MWIVTNSNRARMRELAEGLASELAHVEERLRVDVLIPLAAKDRELADVVDGAKHSVLRCMRWVRELRTRLAVEE